MGKKMQLNMLRKLHHHSRVHMYDKVRHNFEGLTKLTRGGMMTKNQVADSESETKCGFTYLQGTTNKLVAGAIATL